MAEKRRGKYFSVVSTGRRGFSKLEEESVPQDIKKQTTWRMKKFNRWWVKKIECDLELMLPTELNGIFRRFNAEVEVSKERPVAN